MAKLENLLMKMSKFIKWEWLKLSQPLEKRFWRCSELPKSERYLGGRSGTLKRFSSAPQQDSCFSRAGNVWDTKYPLRASSHKISIRSLENKWNHSVHFWKHLVFQTESFRQMNSKIYLCPCVSGIAWGGGQGSGVGHILAMEECISTSAFSWVSQHFTYSFLE